MGVAGQEEEEDSEPEPEPEGEPEPEIGKYYTQELLHLRRKYYTHAAWSMLHGPCYCIWVKLSLRMLCMHIWRWWSSLCCEPNWWFKCWNLCTRNALFGKTYMISAFTVATYFQTTYFKHDDGTHLYQRGCSKPCSKVWIGLCTWVNVAKGSSVLGSALNTDFRVVSPNTVPQMETEPLNIALTVVLRHDVMHNHLYSHLQRLFCHQYWWF